MAGVNDYSVTHQGVRNLDTPNRPGGTISPQQAGRPEENAACRTNGVNIGRTERSLSGAGGAVLVGLGLGRGGLLGLSLAALGGGLIYRGATGHCAAYAAAGINTAERCE